MDNKLLLTTPKKTWLNHCDPRLRIIAAVAFALVIVNLTHLLSVGIALSIAVLLALSSGLNPHQLLWRLLALESFMLLVLLTLPFTVPGTPLFSLGALTASYEGLLKALLILLKANAVVLIVLALIGSLEPIVFGHALARLGVPAKLVHLLLLTLRQMQLLQAELNRLRQAMRARAFVPGHNRHTWQSYGYLIGMLLVRSLARSQRILAAMRCRGFQGRLYLLDTSTWQTTDTALASGLVVILLSLSLSDYLL